MRALPLLTLFFLASLTPAFALRQVTVAEFEQILAAAHDKSDAKVAGQLAEFQLTERVSSIRLARWESDYPGPRTREALTQLADASSFLDLPAAEIPASPPPDREAQRQMLSRTIDYAAKTIHNLPNFIATRQTIHYEDSPAEQHIVASGASPGSNYHTMRTENFSTDITKYEPLHVTGKSSIAVAYRDGQEVPDVPGEKKQKHEPEGIGLTTSGEFGPILSVVLNDAFRSHMEWGYWEHGPTGLIAVFRYLVPQTQSHYLVEFSHGPDLVRTDPTYRGEIALDPATGSILRLTVVSSLAPPFETINVAIRVDYAPVVIGNRTYICPAKGVALSKMPAAGSSQPTPPPLQTRLNDVAFTNYHLFRADARIVPADGKSGREP